MKYSISALVLGFFAALSVAAPTPDDKPPTKDVSISDVKYGGSGCKAGTAAVSHSQDLQTVTVIFDEYQANIGPGVPFSEKNKNCNLNFKINYPPGYQYTLYKIDYTGYADLQDGISANQQSQYWFAGIDGRATLRSNFKGPLSKTYTFTDLLATSLWVWSPCGASTTLNVNTMLSLSSSNSKSSGSISTQVIDTTVKNKYYAAYGVSWRRCTK